MGEMSQWVPGALSLGIKWPGREADHSPPSGAIPPLPQYAFMTWCLVKHFTFLPYFWLENLRVRDHLEDLGIYGRIILEYIY
jgi:hypothetical protein